MPQQKITACAFLHKDGKLFIAKRAATKKFLPNKYELPGGHIEYGETMEAGLQREFQEEFGVDIIVGEPFYVFTYLREENNTHVVEVDYFVSLKDETQDIQLHPEDHSEHRWISVEEVDVYLDPADVETQAVRKGFLLLQQSND